MINHPKRNRRAAAPSIDTSDIPETKVGFFKGAKLRTPRARSGARRSTDHDYSALLECVDRAFQLATTRGPVFKTDATGLFDLYLDTLPAERQHHTCTACRRFIEHFGGLVTVHESGALQPVMWDTDYFGDKPHFYIGTVEALYHRVRAARVVSPFLTKDAFWGMRHTGQWQHPAVIAPAHWVYEEAKKALTAGQAMALAIENAKNVRVALGEFSAALLDEALRIVKADALDRSERFIAPLVWLRALHDRPKGNRGENILWLAVATAPDGYCHPRASVIGSLLEDLKEGMGFKRVKERFDAKVRPTVYQRPQAAPTAGNVASAEKLFEKLGLAPALERRFARLDEILDHVAWYPTAPGLGQVKSGVFGHLATKGSTPPARQDLPTRVMTWVKFKAEVMPRASAIDFLVPSQGNFIAYTTAVHADAPPILKWDREDERNPVSMYVYTNGSTAASWKLSPIWTRVNAIAPFPNLWGSRPRPELFEGAMLVLDGAQDMRGGHDGLFPECLNSEMHGVRSTIEAFSKSAKLAGRDEASACGYTISKAAKLGPHLKLRAFVDGGWQAVEIDRWD